MGGGGGRTAHRGLRAAADWRLTRLRSQARSERDTSPERPRPWAVMRPPGWDAAYPGPEDVRGPEPGGPQLRLLHQGLRVPLNGVRSDGLVHVRVQPVLGRPRELDPTLPGKPQPAGERTVEGPHPKTGSLLQSRRAGRAQPGLRAAGACSPCRAPSPHGTAGKSEVGKSEVGRSQVGRPRGSRPGPTLAGGGTSGRSLPWAHITSALTWSPPPLCPPPRHRVGHTVEHMRSLRSGHLSAHQTGARAAPA